MIKIQNKSLSSCGKLLLVSQIVLKAISFFLHVIFNVGQVYIPIMLLHLLNSFRFLVQVGETMYVPLAEAGSHQVEQHRPNSFKSIEKKNAASFNPQFWKVFVICHKKKNRSSHLLSALLVPGHLQGLLELEVGSF